MLPYVLGTNMLILALFIVGTNLEATKISNDSEVVTQIQRIEY